jgi:hypothetical protein
LAKIKNNMSYELTGKLVAKYDTVQRTETFKTREFAVEKTDDINGRTIVNYVKFQSVQDKTEIIDRVNIGDNIKVYFNVKGSKWEKDGKTNYITNLDAWRIEQLLAPGSATQPQAPRNFEPLDNFTASDNNTDDLPF